MTRYMTHKSLEVDIESWIEAKESTQGNRVKSGSLAKAIHRYKQGTEKPKMILRRTFLS